MDGKRIRIACLITDLDVGGAEKNLVTLAKGLDAGRFEVSVASLMPAGALARELAYAGIPVTDMGVRSRADLRGVWRVVKWLRRARPDVLHTWLFHANILGRCAAAALGVPAVVSSIRVAESRRSHLVLERLTSRLADRILTNSSGLRDYVLECGIEPGRVEVIPNAVDPGRFARERKSGKRGGTPTVLFVGRLAEQKGVDVLLRAAAELRRRRGLMFEIVGDGPDRAKLERLVRELGLTNVHFTGRSGRVPESLAEADMLALPSRWEGMPNVVLEAMAARCPVVATDVTGTRDLVRDGVNGLLVPVDDHRALAAGIERLLDADTLAKSLAENGYETARRHSVASMVEAHQAIYLDVLNRADQPR